MGALVDFRDTAEEATWRAECRTWLVDNAPKVAELEGFMAKAKAWQAMKFEAGFAKIPWDDEFVINGQKVWTSGAHLSDWGEVLCRTNPDAPKHKGITAFIVDMRAPGVTVRPLRQMTGGADFNEVFFDDVRVPADRVLGEVH